MNVASELDTANPFDAAVLSAQEAFMGKVRTENIGTLFKFMRFNGSRMVIDLLIRCGAPNRHVEALIQGCFLYDQDNWVLSLPVGAKQPDPPPSPTGLDIVRELPPHHAYFLLGIADTSGLLTLRGKDFLDRMGVYTGKDVSIAKSTFQNLVTLYSVWKSPRPNDPELELLVGRNVNVPEETILSWNKAKQLRQSHKMGIRIGDGTKIGEDVSLGLGVSIGANCQIMDRAELCDFSIIRDRASLGKAVLIREDSEIRTGSRLMDKAVVAPRNVVSENSCIPEGVVFNQCKKYQYEHEQRNATERILQKS